MKRKYELTVILSPQLSSTELTKTVKALSTLIEKQGGKIVKKEDWGTKKLAYVINKQKEGVYRHYVVELKPDTLAVMDRELKLVEGILRYLIAASEK